MAESHAIIFMASELSRDGLKPLEYENARERVRLYTSLFKDVFQFDKVAFCPNYSKADIIEKLAELEAESKAFEEHHEPQTIFCVAIVWIGFKLAYYYPKQKVIMN